MLIICKNNSQNVWIYEKDFVYLLCKVEGKTPTKFKT